MKNVAIAILLLVVCAVKTVAVPIRVVDEAGEPVGEFEILVQAPGKTGEAWIQGSDGMAEVELDLEKSGAIAVAVRTPKLAPLAKQFDGAEKERLLAGEMPITLEQGEEVRLRLKLPEGVELPDGFAPQVYFQAPVARRVMVWIPKTAEQAATDPNMLAIEATDEGEYEFRLAKEPREFFVGINEPGFLRFFEAGPFTIADVKEGVLEIDVPAPATVNSGLAIEQSADELPFEKVQFSLMGTNMRERAYFMASTETKPIAEAGTFDVDDLAPGEYVLLVQTLGAEGAAPAERNAIDPARFTDRQQLSVAAGETKDVEVQYVPYDENAFRGDRNAAISVVTQAGAPAEGKSVKITFSDGHYGSLLVHEGLVPADGIVRLEGLTDRQPAPGPYMIEVNGERMGLFQIKPEDELQEFEYRLAPGAGDPAPDFEFTDIRTNETRRLADFAGKPVFLEFWATWCGPCQPALEKVDGLIAKHDQWQGKVEFLPISIDNDIALVSPHLENKGWTNLPQYWTGSGEEVGFKAPAVTAYVVRGIPNAMLIDAEGKIVWRGHPMSIDLAEQINALLGIDGEGETAADELEEASASGEPAGERQAAASGR